MNYAFPADPESTLATLAELFKSEGKTLEVAVIANSTAEFTLTESDNWNGGIDYWQFNMRVPARILTLSLDECKSNVGNKLHDIFGYLPHHHISEVNILPNMETDTEWRTKSNSWLNGVGVNNQGRARSDNVASRSHDGLLFRSQAEINLYLALKSLGIPFAPLPVFVKGGGNFQRIEPDFVIYSEGVMMVIEVDGEPWHTESPVDAHERTTLFTDEGAILARVKAADCRDKESAALCAQKLKVKLMKAKSLR